MSTLASVWGGSSTWNNLKWHWCTATFAAGKDRWWHLWTTGEGFPCNQRHLDCPWKDHKPHRCNQQILLRQNSRAKLHDIGCYGHYDVGIMWSGWRAGLHPDNVLHPRARYFSGFWSYWGSVVWDNIIVSSPNESCCGVYQLLCLEDGNIHVTS